MMLQSPIDAVRVQDETYAANQPTPINTIMGGVLNFVAPATAPAPVGVDTTPTYKQVDYNPYTPDIQQPQPIDTSAPAGDFADKFTRMIDIPTVLDLKTTDKTSTGVYETAAPQQPLINATLLNNPAVDNFETAYTQPQSPLGANFAGQSVIASGQDPQQFYQGAGVNPVAAQPTTSTDSPSVFVDDGSAPDSTAPAPAPVSWWDSLFTTPGGNSIKGEITILLVGLIVLAIGIYALTR